MTDSGELNAQNSGTTEGVNLKDLVLDLTLVPAWARKPPGHEVPVPETDTAEDSAKRKIRAKRGQARPGLRGMQQRGGRREPPERSPREKVARPPRGAQRAPVTVSFLPEQRQIARLVRQLRASKKAYPLAGLGALFVSKPDFCAVKIEAAGDSVRLFQCKLCRAVALARPTLERHLARRHLDDYFEKETTEGEPPSGQFVCVARCGLSGILLGPPNHHTFAEKMHEVRQTLFPEMPLAQYRAKIEMLRDQELIERWRQEASRRVVYRPKKATVATVGPLSRLAAESLFMKEMAPGLMATTSRAIVPVNVALEIEDAALRAFIQEMWQRETRNPRSVTLALRAALRNLALRLFLVEGRVEYVSAVQPCPLALEHAAPNVRAMLMFVHEHAGCTRQQLVDELLAGPSPEAGSAEPGQLHSQLTWLVEKGHLIEFFDGRLMAALPEPANAPASARGAGADQFMTAQASDTPPLSTPARESSGSTQT